MKLAQSKVSQVESECQNQNLQHQLSTLIAKLNNSQPANTSAANSWKAKIKWDTVVVPSFQSHIADIANQLNSLDEPK